MLYLKDLFGKPFLAPDGRRIMVSWSNEWEWMPLWKDWGPTYKEGWCGCFNIPREVRMRKDHTLQFIPVQEVENLRENAVRKEEIVVEEKEMELTAGDGVCYELKFMIDLTKTDARQLELVLRCGERKKTAVVFDFAGGELYVDRSNADGWSRGSSRSVLFLKGKNELDVHILSDQSSLELFTDSYQNNHSNNIFALDKQNKLYVRACGGRAVFRKLEAYGLKNCFGTDTSELD